MEALRLLTNHDLDSITVRLLLGQPTLRRRMKLGVLAALDQRIVRRHMTGMTNKETASYLRHHLQLAGRDDALFSDDAVGLIHQTSRGYPRAVNNLALQALVAAFAADKSLLDESTTRTAVAEDKLMGLAKANQSLIASSMAQATREGLVHPSSSQTSDRRSR